MADTPAFQAHFDYLLGRSPELASQLVDQVQASLRAASADNALAHDRNRLFVVAEAIQRDRVKFEHALNTQIQATVRSANDPAQPVGSSLELRLDQLTLVDEDEAEKEIEVSRTVQLIDLKAEWELRELQAFNAALLGEAKPDPQRNPFRPAIYARALSSATRELALHADERHMLLRIAGRALADLLKQTYAQACERLKQAGVSPLAFKAVTTPRRPRHSDVDVSQAGSLQSLLERLPASMQQPAASSPVIGEAPALTFQSLPAAAPAGWDAHQAHAALIASNEQIVSLLNTLFSQMQADTDVQPAIKQMINQLQPAVLRVARQDPQILDSSQHPAWRFINQLASYASGYAQTDQAGLDQFLDFIKPRIQQLVPAPGPTADQFQSTIDEVQTFVAQQSQTQLHTQPQAMQQLQEADQRMALRPMLQQQVEQQIGQARIKSSIRTFLLGPWVDVLTHAMIGPGADDEQAQQMMATVDDLLGSLRRPQNDKERAALKKALPGLVARIQQGMHHIQLPQDQQDALLKDLMGIHGHYLLGALLSE